VTGFRLRWRALLLLALLLTALGGGSASPSAADDGPDARGATCFGRYPTHWATPGVWLYGTQGDDVIMGSAGGDLIWGMGGDDLICGNGGHDLLFGGSGRDRIQGGPGNDILYGKGGRDLLQGGPGRNILNGGEGSDRCLSGDTYVSCELPSVDKILAQCPTKREIARIDAEFDLSFEGSSPSPVVFACTPAGGSAYLTPLQKRAYNAVRIMGRISFDAPLPWANATLEDWFAGAITGIRFRDDIDNSFCCNPEGVINIKTGWPLPASQATDLWMKPEWNVGLAHLMILMVHEARHAEGPAHTCNWNAAIQAFVDDNHIADLGAWGVQYYLETWLADHTSQAFLAGPAGDRPYHQDRHRADAGFLMARFCDEP
jgi:hypothetical protein